MLRFFERLLWTLGSATLAVALVFGLGLSQLSQNRFAFANTAAGDAPDTVSTDWRQPDHSDWSKGRIAAFFEAVAGSSLPEPQASLRIPAVGVESAVFAGTGEWALNAGVGTIEGTAAIGEPGNLGIAGHRDGYFRRLKDIGIGDLIEIRHAGGLDRYEVTETLIVEPEDVYVLDPTPRASLTLVTCYPFYFLGSAPERFIVKGVRIDTLQQEGI